MKPIPAIRQTLWVEVTAKLQQEWFVLGDDDRIWITGTIEQLADRQQQLHQLVAAVQGETICRDCAGACCGHGFYHPTLVTILAHFVFNQPLPVPDFTRSCPYLDAAGCQFHPSLRPFNCLTFVCEQIDSRYSQEQRSLMQRLEQEIRHLYEQFDRRYVGSNLRGLMNRVPGARFTDLLERRDMLD